MTETLFSIEDLRIELGLEAHETQALRTWTGEDDTAADERVFTRAWFDDMVSAWHADSARIADLG